MCHELASNEVSCASRFSRRGRQCGVLGKENRYDEQTEGNGSIGWSVRCGGGDDDSFVRMGFSGIENGAGSGLWATSCRAEHYQPVDYGRGHRYATTRFASKENAGHWAESVSCRQRGAKVLADLQPLRQGPTGSKQPEI